MKLFFIATLSCFLSGCAILNTVPDLTIDGIVIKNQTAQTIYNIRVHVDKTKAFAYCSHVYTNGECSTGFQIKRYQGNPIRITWEQDNKAWSTDEFFVTMPEAVVPDRPATAKVVVTGNGVANATLVQ